MENTNNLQNEADIEQFLAGKTEDEIMDMFIEQMLVEKGFGNISDELKEEFRREIKERLIFKINEAIVASLPDDQLAKLDELLALGEATADNINDLVDKSGVDISEPIQRTMLEFREAYLAPEEKVR